MEIQCPHCHVAFKGNNCVLKERKSKYKWYEFTGKASHCPHCDGRYQADLSIAGFVYFVLLVIVTALVARFSDELMAIPILFLGFYFGKKYTNKIMKITAIDAT